MLGGDYKSKLTLQSSQRRKLKRLFDNLGGDSQDIVMGESNVESVKRIKTNSCSIEKNEGHDDVDNKEVLDDGQQNHQPKPIPYVVFVGQLAFSTTKEQIESHFRNEGHVDGCLKVRILTHRDNNRSKGMAFVQVEGSRELRKCLRMHQSCLNGRIINVEQSTGKKGKNIISDNDGNVDKVAARNKKMFAPPPLRPAKTI